MLPAAGYCERLCHFRSMVHGTSTVRHHILLPTLVPTTTTTTTTYYLLHFYHLPSTILIISRGIIYPMYRGGTNIVGIGIVLEVLEVVSLGLEGLEYLCT